eukprot:148976-Prymnesium_polylepis.2
MLGDGLIAFGGTYSEATLEAVDRLLDQESVAGVAPGALYDDTLWLSVGRCKVAVFQGDITSLRVGAVVNAANEQGLGCFVPRHRCIDNVIHRAAGPRLREECRRKMAARGAPLAAGTPPLLTAGYHLPAEHVLHVTGPQLALGEAPSALQRAQLAACYTGCLDEARHAGIRSVAFCCISTGLFCFPAHEAATIALSVVRDWLRADEVATDGAASIDTIVFDVFGDADREIYHELAPAMLDARGAARGSQEA